MKLCGAVILASALFVCTGLATAMLWSFGYYNRWTTLQQYHKQTCTVVDFHTFVTTCSRLVDCGSHGGGGGGRGGEGGDGGGGRYASGRGKEQYKVVTQCRTEYFQCTKALLTLRLVSSNNNATVTRTLDCCWTTDMAVAGGQIDCYVNSDPTRDVLVSFEYADAEETVSDFWAVSVATTTIAALALVGVLVLGGLLCVRSLSWSQSPSPKAALQQMEMAVRAEVATESHELQNNTLSF